MQETYLKQPHVCSYTTQSQLHKCLAMHINQVILVASYIYLTARVITDQNRHLCSFIHDRMHHHLQVYLSKSPKDKMAYIEYGACVNFYTLHKLHEN